MIPTSESHKGVHLIAHRGWSRYFPRIAYRPLLRLSAALMRLSLMCGYLGSGAFICHDPTTARVSNLSGDCSAYTMAELRNAQIRLPQGYIQGPGFPTLLDTLSCSAIG